MTVVVGGQSRNAGKTSIVAGLIAALREMEWVAVKVTQYGHGVCSRHGEPCDCEPEDRTHGFSLSEEYEAGDTDSARFLAAGARRAFWLRTATGELSRAAAVIRKILANNANVIFESNSILEVIEPDLYLLALDQANPDFKASAARHLDRADAFVISHAGPVEAATPTWRDRPAFVARGGEYVSAGLAEFVRRRGAQPNGAPKSEADDRPFPRRGVN
jgi:hypothetical protein